MRVPWTTPTKYLSFQAALNLRLPGEYTGDWHHSVAFFVHVDNPWTLVYAGPGGLTDSTPSLGSHGVRDMAHLLEDYVVAPGSGPVWVANHYRAIVDYAMLDLTRGICPPKPMMAGACTINQWLDTPEQVKLLVEEYLKPLRRQLNGMEKEAYDRWIPTVVWQP